MERELAAYLRDFEYLAELKQTIAPVTLLPGTTAPSLPDMYREGLAARLPPLYVSDAQRVADVMVGSGLLSPTLPPGTTAMYPPLPPPPPPALTADQWVAKMRGWGYELVAINAEINRLRLPGVAKHTSLDTSIHISNDYGWREYPMPASGVCDPALLTWITTFTRAKTALIGLAEAPPPGTPGIALRQWAANIRAAAAALVESTNTRFFNMEFTRTTTGTPTETESGDLGAGNLGGVAPSVEGRLTGGLASRAQTNGAYTYDPRGDTAPYYEAMAYAPKPEGGWADLFTGTKASWLVRKRVIRCLDGGACCFLCVGTDGYAAGDFGRGSVDPFFDSVLEAWERTGRTSPVTRLVKHRDRVHTARATFDVGAWIENHLNIARVLADPVVSLAEIVMRSNGFYINAYLDYAARRGVLPTNVVADARAAWASIRQGANDSLNATVGTAAGLVTAIVSAINGAAGAVVGVILAIVALLIALGGAAVGHTGAYVPLPYYLRSYGGSCVDRAWLPPPTAPAPTAPTAVIPPEGITLLPDEPPPEPKKGGGLLAVGAGAALLWLMMARRR